MSNKSDYGASHWSSDKVWKRRRQNTGHQLTTTDPAFWLSSVEVRLNIHTLMAVHGCLCLALRHPGVPDATRKLVEKFTKQIGEYLVRLGALTAEQLLEAERLEAKAAPEG